MLMSNGVALTFGILTKHRNAVYGFAILWIVLFHGAAIDGVDYSFGIEGGVAYLTSEIIAVGNVGVDIFLFLSGICLYFSFTGDPDIYSFIKKRLWRLVPPALITYGVYWFIRYAVLANDFGAFLSRMTLMQFWMTGDQAIWFVSLILVLYALYPYIYRFLFAGSARFIRFLLLLCASFGVGIILRIASPELYDMVEIAVTRIPIFVIGCGAGRIVYEGRKITNPAIFIVIPLMLMVLFFAVINADILHGMERRYFYIIGGLSLTFVLSLAIHGLSIAFKFAGDAIERFFAFFGGFSLEWYLAHIMVNQVLQLSPWYEKGSLIQYLTVMLLSCIFAWMVMMLCAKIRPYVFGGMKKRTVQQ